MENQKGTDIHKISTYEEAYNYGVQISRRKVAKSLLEDDCKIAMIDEVTSLPVEEIEKLQKNILEIEIYKRFFKARHLRIISARKSINQEEKQYKPEFDSRLPIDRGK